MPWNWAERASAVVAARAALHVSSKTAREEGGAMRHREAVRAFNRASEQAWPPDFWRVLADLQSGHATSGDLDLALEFLEVNPMFFRSGYIADTALRRLARSPRSADQTKRMEALALAAVDAPRRPRFAAFCKLARQVGGEALREALAQRRRGGDPAVQRRAEQMLDAMAVPLRPGEGRVDVEAVLVGCERGPANREDVWPLLCFFSNPAARTPERLPRIAELVRRFLPAAPEGFEIYWYVSPAQGAFLEALHRLAPTDERARRVLASIEAWVDSQRQTLRR